MCRAELLAATWSSDRREQSRGGDRAERGAAIVKVRLEVEVETEMETETEGAAGLGGGSSRVLGEDGGRTRTREGLGDGLERWGDRGGPCSF